MGPEHTFNFNFTGVANATAVTIHLHLHPLHDVMGPLTSMANSLAELVDQGDDKAAASTLTSDVKEHADALKAALPDASV